jgi:hypothetical protein
MAYGNPFLTKADLFIKSSVADFQDPSFLTFVVDFFPVREQYPRNDGFYNDNLLMAPASVFSTDSAIDLSRHSRDPINTDNPNAIVEYSTYDWLGDYYGSNYNQLIGDGTPHPQDAMLRFITGIKNIQSSPWYFQSVSGINQLWKTTHRVKEGDKKDSTLTFSCLESIKQPLTEIAENYRYAIYDAERLSYRVPDNLRWFDMTIHLIEVRDIRDYGQQSALNVLFSDPANDLFTRDGSGRTTGGLKVVRFRCKMCEFDFSDFFSDEQFYTYTTEKPFSPSFKIKVGWVVQDEVALSDADDMRQDNILTGAFNALSNRLSNVLRSLNRLPANIIGSVANDIQTRVEGLALGNAYDGGGLNGISNAINQFGASITGRKAPVGPSFADLTKSKIYESQGKPPIVRNGDLGDVYE